ncbi:phosphatase PAP2 family protein [Maritimibacter sp. UBA3975]|uniref:phosphatase PAP2 family protein n=1 Tax=Maritimibacter sp. UBA3975 TaxID=1946833 RepID=UPI000C0B8D74|nr:phosphatase PAP2 family protein [Maritimibacter sp. UBA3975]MAM60675.1 PA-phosphatase [Maritimibacter sp.]
MPDRSNVIAALLRRVETVTLLAVLCVAGGVWAFVVLSGQMIEGDLRAFDESVLMALRSAGDPATPIGGPQVEVVMRDITALGGVTVLTLVTVAALVHLVLRGRRGAALFLAIAVLGGRALSHVAKAGFDRPRPDLVPHGVEVATASFPSGHSMMAAVTYLTLAVMLARLEGRRSIRAFYAVAAVLLTLSVGVSRVYLGVHWPSDVLAGWTLGAAWALIVWLVARWIGKRREAAHRPAD